MASKNWHPNFIKYMDFIATHENYKGLAIEKKQDGSWSWIAPKQSKIGTQRLEWCKNKAREFGLSPDEAGVLSVVMRRIHPTGEKVCQVCGKSMSIFYYYPNHNFVTKISKKYQVTFDTNTHIGDIYDSLLALGFSENSLKRFFIESGKLEDCYINESKEKILNALEEACRCKGLKLLGPGAMSNFPDRFDGFHTYNRCCRSSEDKGRSKENLRSYGKDRRAYEYWSDGNIHAADQFMNSPFFKGSSADHVGPISLGFIHDPAYLQKMKSSDNSSKRDRLQKIDIDKIIKIEKKTGIYPVSWFASIIWEDIKSNYNQIDLNKLEQYREALKQNMANFMYILHYVIEKCGNTGRNFLEEAYLKPKMHYFDFSYSFDKNGIISKKNRHFTERNQNEYLRYKRIAFDSVLDFHEKENRNIKYILSNEEKESLDLLCRSISSKFNINFCKQIMTNIMKLIQKRLIENI